MTLASMQAGDETADFTVARSTLYAALDEPLVVGGKARTVAEAELRQALGLSA